MSIFPEHPEINFIYSNWKQQARSSIFLEPT